MRRFGYRRGGFFALLLWIVLVLCVCSACKILPASDVDPMEELLTWSILTPDVLLLPEPGPDVPRGPAVEFPVSYPQTEADLLPMHMLAWVDDTTSADFIQILQWCALEESEQELLDGSTDDILLVYRLQITPEELKNYFANREATASLIGVSYCYYSEYAGLMEQLNYIQNRFAVPVTMASKTGVYRQYMQNDSIAFRCFYDTNQEAAMQETMFSMIGNEIVTETAVRSIQNAAARWNARYFADIYDS